MTAITKYFVGGEREAFIAGSNSAITWSTTVGLYDPDFSRGAVTLAAVSTAYISAPLSTPQAESYHGVMHYRSGQAETNTAWFQFVDSGFVPLFRVMAVGGVSGQPILQWQYWNGSAWVGVGVSRVVPSAQLHKWDFEFNLAGSGGFARAYVDGVLLGELTGDTTVGGAVIAEMRVYGAGSGNYLGTLAVSECQILDVSTLGRRLSTLYITGAGAGNTLTSGTYADVDEAGVYTDTDYVSSDTAGQVATFVTSDLSTAAQQYIVDGLVIAYRAQKGGVGPQNLQGAVRIGGTNYFSSSVPTLVTAFGYTWADFPENPATAANFTPAEINTAGFETGLKSVA